MKAIVNQSKLTPYDECTNPKLKNFADKVYIKSHCMNLYGEDKIGRCQQKKEFCPMCCEFHIGTKFANKRNDCKTRCHTLLYGKKSEKKSVKNSKKDKGKGKKKTKSKKGKGKKKSKSIKGKGKKK